ncbi:AAA-like domain-containing protein [Candidatus Entotheonella palauensis]|uniref:AAA-like domain-containing protein n=1 Tax=Candidatus Entotheonella palauensis TaxID=93172 RepID=UPI000B7FE933|nr:AAA-like domain-containing protein [Candidatus Entotheonella palauensis]
MSASNDFFQDSGTLAPDAPSYIERPADHELLAALEQHEFCLVLAPRQTGKSSLMVHAAARLREMGLHAGVVDLQALGIHQDPGPWFSDMLYQIERSLRLKTDSALWEESHVRLGPTQRFLTFLEDVVLTELHGDVVLFFDEIDSVLNLPFSDDFFTTLRSLFNARAEKPALRRLSIVLLGLATPSSFIRNRSRTPFNIGRSIALDDFNRVATKPFQEKLGRNSGSLIDRIFYWTNGQPWLVQRLAAAVYAWPEDERSPERIDREVKDSYLQSNIIEHDTHFKFIRNYLLERSPYLRKTLVTYRRVLRGKIVGVKETSPVQIRLKLAGVVRVLGNRLVVRNRMYEHIFDQQWVREHAPHRIKNMLVYGLPTVLAIVLLWIYVVQPGFFPFLTRMPQIVKYTKDPSAVIEIETEHVRRAYLNEMEILVPQNGLIQLTLRDFSPGPQAYELRFEGGFFNQSYTIPIEITYYPDWKIRLFQEESPLSLGGGVVSDVAAFDGHREGVYFVAFAPNGQTVVSGSEDNTLKLWDVNTGRVLHTFTGHDDDVIGVAFSPAGRQVLSGSLDSTLRLWDVKTGQVLHTFTGHEEGVLSVAFSPDGQRVLSGSLDRTLRLWKAKSGQVLHEFRGHAEAVNGVAFSLDGQRVLSGSQDGTLKLWDVESGQVLHTLTGHAGAVTGVAFSPDGQQVLSGSEDSTLKLWDAESGKELRTYQGHTESVIGVAFALDGRTVVSGSDDHTLRLWDVATTDQLRLFEGHTKGVIGVAFTPDGKMVISGSLDQTLRLWWAATEPP